MVGSARRSGATGAAAAAAFADAAGFGSCLVGAGWSRSTGPAMASISTHADGSWVERVSLGTASVVSVGTRPGSSLDGWSSTGRVSSRRGDPTTDASNEPHSAHERRP
jgi:hypothetical protein